MIELKLNPQEADALAKLIDMALRAHGMNVAKAASHLHDKLAAAADNAALREQAAAAVAETKEKPKDIK